MERGCIWLYLCAHQPSWKEVLLGNKGLYVWRDGVFGFTYAHINHHGAVGVLGAVDVGDVTLTLTPYIHEHPV